MACLSQDAVGSADTRDYPSFWLALGLTGLTAARAHALVSSNLQVDAMKTGKQRRLTAARRDTPLGAVGGSRVHLPPGMELRQAASMLGHSVILGFDSTS